LFLLHQFLLFSLRLNLANHIHGLLAECPTAQVRRFDKRLQPLRLVGGHGHIGQLVFELIDVLGLRLRDFQLRLVTLAGGFRDVLFHQLFRHRDLLFCRLRIFRLFGGLIDLLNSILVIGLGLQDCFFFIRLRPSQIELLFQAAGNVVLSLMLFTQVLADRTHSVPESHDSALQTTNNGQRFDEILIDVRTGHFAAAHGLRPFVGSLADVLECVGQYCHARDGPAAAEHFRELANRAFCAKIRINRLEMSFQRVHLRADRGRALFEIAHVRAEIDDHVGDDGHTNLSFATAQDLHRRNGGITIAAAACVVSGQSDHNVQLIAGRATRRRDGEIVIGVGGRQVLGSSRADVRPERAVCQHLGHHVNLCGHGSRNAHLSAHANGNGVRCAVLRRKHK